MNWLSLYILVWITATVLGAVFTYFARALAPHFNLWDKPQSEHHKNHTRPTPVAGGMAMWASWIATLGGGLLLAFLLKSHFSDNFQAALKGVADAKGTLLLIIGCATGLMIMGLCDDHHAMHAGAKFLCQFIAAGLTAWFGPHVLAGYCPFLISWALTTLWIATVINAMNFFDNMDGLAGGTGVIALFFLLVIAALRGQYFVGMLTAATGGAVLGFLFFNVAPASIFMGDSGSHFLGYLLAVACILTSFYHPASSPTITPLLIPVLVLSIPLLDAVTVVLIRLHLHQPVYVGDNRHISHRFVNLGLTRPQAVLLVWLLCFIAGSGALSLLWLPAFGAAIILAQILAMMAIVLIIQLCARNNTP